MYCFLFMIIFGSIFDNHFIISSYVYLILYLNICTLSNCMICPQNLCSSQTWSLFQLYLQHEYRGSSKELLSALSSYRTESRLLHNIYQFHLTDPMHLLSCRMHLLAAATKKDHPYHVSYCFFLCVSFSFTLVQSRFQIYPEINFDIL